MDSKAYNNFLNCSVMNIKEALDNNNLTLFVGSGVSIDSGIPSWPGLMAEIKKALNTKEKDFLKLAELFYLSFKNNRYYSLLEERIPNSSKPNTLHKEIVKLNAKNIITTNWDELLEKAALDEGEFVDAVHSDEDIGYATGFKKIIKMHGTLSKRNIVFKESDYLNYSQKFPLIENYIKSVFSTDTVLVVGYSLSDVNLNQILSWVNFHSKHIKPIYLLKPGSQFDYLEYEYYKSRNVFVIYWNEANKESSEVVLNKSDLTLEFFNYLDKSCIAPSFFKGKNLENKLLFLFKELNEYSILQPEFFISKLREKFNLYGLNKVFIETDTLTIADDELVDSITKSLKDELFKQELDILLDKVNVRVLVDKNGINFFEDSNDNYDINQELAKLNSFKFKAIKEKIAKKTFSNDASLKGKLDLAFNLYKAREFEEAYLVLKNVAKEAFKERDFVTWYLALFNKKQFYIYLVNESVQNKTINQEELERYNAEIQKINLVNEALKLPIKYRDLLAPLQSLDVYLEKRLLKVITLYEKIIDDHETRKAGGFSYNNYAYNIIHTCYEVQSFVEKNSLAVEYSHSYKRLLELGFKSVCVYFISIENFEIDIGVFLLGVKNTSEHNDILKFFSRYLQKSRLSLIDNDSLFSKSLEELEAEILSQDFYRSENALRYIHNLIVLASFIQLSNEQIGKLFNFLKNLLTNNKLLFQSFEVINFFINLQFKNNSDAVKSSKNEVSSFVKEYIYLYTLGKFNGFALLGLRHTNLFDGLIYVLSELDTTFIFNDLNLIDRFLSKLQDASFEVVAENTSSFLIPLYSISNKEVKQKIVYFYEALIKKDAAVVDEIGKLTLLYYLAKSELGIPVDKKLKELLASVTSNLEANTLEAIKAEPIINAVNTYLEEQAINPSPDDKE